ANYSLFTGEQRDGDSGLYYLRARYYDPAIGRFPSHDPLPTGNLYAYAGNNPVNFVDPSGLCHEEHSDELFCYKVHEKSSFGLGDLADLGYIDFNAQAC